MLCVENKSRFKLLHLPLFLTLLLPNILSRYFKARISLLILRSSNLAYCVVERFVCPSILLTVSIAPLDSVIVVTKICLAK